MKTFCARIAMNGGFISNLSSDTVFGGLCWAVKMRCGEKTLFEIIDLCRSGQPPFVVSDIFPQDLLPKPFAYFSANSKPAGAKKERLEQAKAAKKQKEVKWLTLDEFIAWANGQQAEFSIHQAPLSNAVVIHNTINRLSGTTADEGGLYELVETYAGEDIKYFSLYLRIADGWADKIREALELFGCMGIGKRRSIGKGAFHLKSWESFKLFDSVEGANGFVSLSHFVPSPDDPVRGRYKTVVKYPRLDREYAYGRKPYKHPLMLLVPGSCFYTQGTPKSFYGMAVENIAPDMPEVIQGCYSFAAPVRFNH